MSKQVGGTALLGPISSFKSHHRIDQCHLIMGTQTRKINLWNMCTDKINFIGTALNTQSHSIRRITHYTATCVDAQRESLSTTHRESLNKQNHSVHSLSTHRECFSTQNLRLVSYTDHAGITLAHTWAFLTNCIQMIRLILYKHMDSG